MKMGKQSILKVIEEYNKHESQKRKICACCGEEFYTIIGDWGYKIGNRFFCSYHCMRVIEKAEAGKKRKVYNAPSKRRSKFTDDKILEIKDAIRRNITLSADGRKIIKRNIHLEEMAFTLDVSHNTIAKYERIVMDEMRGASNGFIQGQSNYSTSTNHKKEQYADSDKSKDKATIPNSIFSI